MPRGQTGPWSIDRAARATLGVLLDELSWDDAMGQYAEYLLAFVTGAPNEHPGPDAMLLNGTALALCGYRAAHARPEAQIWRLAGCARLATEAHLRRADIHDTELRACIDAVSRTAEERAAPILADLITLEERMTGRLLDHARAERLEVPAAEFPDHLDVTLGASEIGNHMQARDWQAAPHSPDFLMAGDLDAALAACDNLITLRSHMYVRHQFGSQIDWHLRLFDDKESTVSLNHHRWVRDMVGPWLSGRDPRLPEAAARHIASWYLACPVPNHKQSVGPWRTLEAGNRMANQWPDIFGWFGGTEAFGDELHAMYARSRLDHMRYLSAFCGGSNNWYQVESAGLAVASLLSPEVRLSRSYLELALRRLEWINSFAYYDDGFQFELTPGYHVFPTYSMLNVVRAARASRTDLPQPFVELMAKAHEMYLYAAKPDRTLPRLNDNNPGTVDAGAHLRDAANLFGRTDLLWGGTRGASGRRPEQTSFAWPQAGYYCMRSDWEDDARYLFFDAAPWGASHQHEDKLTFVLHAFGRTLLGDPSIYSYARTELTHYFRSSRAHNVMLIDGMGQARRFDPASKLTTRGRVEWATHGAFDFVSAEYLEGYAPDLYGEASGDTARVEVIHELSHRRAVWFVKPDYWILSDLVEGEGVHTLEQLYHIPPVASQTGRIGPGELSADHDGVRTLDRGRANLHIVPVDRAGLAVAAFHGETDPARGWYTMGGELPAWEVSLAVTEELPARMDAVLWPQPKSRHDAPQVTRLAASPRHTAIGIRANGVDDVFILCEDDCGEVEVDDVQFKGRALLVRRGTDPGVYGYAVEAARVGDEPIAPVEPPR
ncbi:MAG: alginate lyase family protein [bacterium]